MTSGTDLTGVVFPMQKGPFQNNGAAPWYTTLGLGTPPQQLKFALDSGTNIVWSTSTLCAPDRCQHYAGGRFNWEKSSSYKFTDCLDRIFNFGPWGAMTVEAGADKLMLPNERQLDLNLFLSSDYTGPQFAALDWDGGLGLPSSSAYTAAGSSFIMQTMMNNGLIDPGSPYVSFDWDPRSKQGSCQIGGYDESKIGEGGLFLPWVPYLEFDGVQYIWTTPLDSYTVGTTTVATNKMFALDSGSSQFKGDDDIMNDTLKIIQEQGFPNINMKLAGGEININSDIYDVYIDEGPGKGQRIPQFNGLKLTNLVLVGSVLMEYCYTVHMYDVVKCGTEGAYSMKARGMYIFNRPDGPRIITGPSTAADLKVGIEPKMGRCVTA